MRILNNIYAVERQKDKDQKESLILWCQGRQVRTLAMFLMHTSNWSECEYEETEWYTYINICILSNIYIYAVVCCWPIWFGSKALLGASLPHHSLHKENSLPLIPPRPPPRIAKKLFSTRLQKLNADFSFCSSPFRILEIKPFVFNETFPCPREQYHLAICLLALILTQYKKWNVTPFFNLSILTKYEIEMLLYLHFWCWPNVKVKFY